ncbi:MAG: signal recognition particle-docking protein FtsY [Oscillatoriaceae bacterium SKW80]|nr:signal recognition particle-docking protein FtsY [Oscillatoriaceae bacterium SKYG93]MCX8120756.1 signal recognition particle-docking protein FtsY [Oscillatoriaceae bacterium SKW80]MDW8452121.1 signal recognition particle-docking protein FtsY [Oscillatoriaceae cyanobacterium SKYGB_i_bin93]HIK27783.1 signal recognition particle-docking protein FtsY [Oscillatoriaceae cyanobacterium M7585_C2015_266]
MAFNWFRRQYSDKYEQKNDEQTASSAASLAEAGITETASQPTNIPATAEDYLSWAKAAYKNIQKQQQLKEETASTPEEKTVATEATEAEASTKEEPETEEPTATITSETEQATVPFWARAEAERLERMEKLKASAISAPEPETVQPAATQTASGLAFDEEFIWSAEVLAAQGRHPDDISIEEITWLKKLRQGLDKTRRSLINQLKALVGQGPLNQAAVSEIEALLLQADVGVEATDYIINALQKKLRSEVLPPEKALAYLKQILREMLDRPLGNSCNSLFVPEKDKLNIWLLTGVNGAGKTTTIGKLAHLGKKSGYRCLIGAADTFRAAAVEQVKIWGERSGVEVIANPGKNTDPAAVVYDAIEAAKARQTELLLLDTAGRLQNKKNLMDELAKIRRVIDKRAPDANIQSLLVLDATLGQNGLRQAQVFSEVAQLTGVVLTKLDGTAKGGIALAVVQQFGLPIRFIGAGEGIEDLRPFSSFEFVEALISG